MQSQKYCTSKGHENKEALNFCDECKIYICKTCENMHSQLLPNHNIYSLKEDINQIFTGICKEKNHSGKLKYFCENHNILCCAECITPIKDNENGKHKDCDIFLIEEIKKEKKNKLNDNIKNLEQLSLTLENSINEIKKIFEKINESKDNIKIKVQKIFTRIRTQINKREDEIISQIDKKYDKFFFKEDIVKEIDKLPKKVKISLEKGKNVDNEWNKDKNKTNLLINDCINIENTIAHVNHLNDTMRRCKSINLNVNFIPEKKGINKFTKKIKKFGKIILNNLKFVECPIKISYSREYCVSGEDRNIITKTGEDYEWMGTICENELDKSKECIWQIKVLKSEDMKIMVGIAPKDFDINSSMYDNCGWYYSLSDNSLHSEPKLENKHKEILKSDIKEDKKEEPRLKNRQKEKAIEIPINNNIKKDINIPLLKSQPIKISKKEIKIAKKEIIKERKPEMKEIVKKEEKKIPKLKTESSEKSKKRKKRKNSVKSDSSSVKSDSSSISKESKKSDSRNSISIENKKSDSRSYSKENKKKRNLSSDSKEKKKISDSSSNSESEEKSILSDRRCKRYPKKFKAQKKSKSNENNYIIVIFNFEKNSLQFIRDNQIKGEFSDINMDKPLCPAIFLYNTDDTIEIEGFN